MYELHTMWWLVYFLCVCCLHKVKKNFGDSRWKLRKLMRVSRFLAYVTSWWLEKTLFIHRCKTMVVLCEKQFVNHLVVDRVCWYAVVWQGTFWSSFLEMSWLWLIAQLCHKPFVDFKDWLEKRAKLNWFSNQIGIQIRIISYCTWFATEDC